MSLALMNAMNGRPCSCGREHRFDSRVISGMGVLEKLPEEVRLLGGTKVFLLADRNTYRVAGEKAAAILTEAGIPVTAFAFPEDQPEPDEHSVGAAVMHMDAACDIVVAVGSGVVNDIGKILSALSRRPYIIVATAPSMDGYASATSSMNRSGLKISLPSRCADTIIGDGEILSQAPMKLLRSGIGDMLAKYISICEWRIANLLLGEYYCEEVAELIRDAVAQCVHHADGLLQRKPEAVMAVFEGLIIGGVAMNYAGVSRPASGVEHYISHVLDMRDVEFGTGAELHGIQCAMGTYISAGLYEKLKTVTLDREKALTHAKAFDGEAWNAVLREMLGKGAESMIALEKKERKYDVARHEARLEKIFALWPQILAIMEQEIPTREELDSLYEKLELPKTLSDIGQNETMLPTVLRCTKDIRDKYVLSRLAWDLGLEEELFG
jgi:glycerol-1-phosphate dehydrogenase [NAD(P)+]